MSMFPELSLSQDVAKRFLFFIESYEIRENCWDVVVDLLDSSFPYLIRTEETNERGLMLEAYRYAMEILLERLGDKKDAWVCLKLATHYMADGVTDRRVDEALHIIFETEKLILDRRQNVQASNNNSCT